MGIFLLTLSERGLPVSRPSNPTSERNRLSMIRPASLRALALTPVVAFGLPAVTARAEQPQPADPPKQSDQVKPSDATKINGVQNPNVKIRQTPAQDRYGVPRNPLLGQPDDLDLSKPLTLERAIRIGLQRQNSIAIAGTQTDAANARLTRARSSYFPQVKPSYSYQYSKQPGGQFTVGGNVIRGSGVSETTNDGINVSQLIFDTGLREANAGQARRSAFAAEYGLGNERQNVILNVTQSYYNVLRNRELLRVQQESVVRAQRTLESVQAQVAVGNAAESDTFQADADLANAKLALLQAQNDYNVSQATLKNAMGVVSYQPLLFADTNVAAPSTEPDKAGLEEYVKTAYASRLDIKEQQERVNAQGYSVRVANINNGVQVNANINQGYQLDPASGESRSFIVSASYPLFDAGATRASVRENKALLEQERRTLDQLEQSIRLNIEQSYIVREQARQRISAGDVAVLAAQRNYDAAKARLENGLINVIDLINAQVQLVNAEVSRVQAVYDFYIAEGQLQRNIGLNDPVYLPRIPGARPPRPGSPLISFQSQPLGSTPSAPMNGGGRKP